MNPLPKPLMRGTFGELLVQLRLLQHSVQAAPPIKDSGNDLIGIRGDSYKAVQVKTTARFPARFKMKDLPDRYHVLAIVVLDRAVDNSDLIDFNVTLDRCRVFLLEKKDVTKGYFSEKQLDPFKLSKNRVDQLWPR